MGVVVCEVWWELLCVRFGGRLLCLITRCRVGIISASRSLYCTCHMKAGCGGMLFKLSSQA